MGITKDELITLLENEKDFKKIEFYLYEYLLANKLSSEEIKDIYSNVGLMNRIRVILSDSYFSKNGLIKLYDTSIDKEEREITCYEDFSSSYSTVIKEFVLLSQKLGCTNSLEVGILFSLLLREGIFSITSSHEYGLDLAIDIFGHAYVNIFHGDGVCLNYSDMLKDIYRSLGYKASNMLNEYSELEEGLNHVGTLVAEKDEFYIFDSTYLTIFNCKNEFKAINVSGVGKMNLSPYFTCSLFSYDKDSYPVVKEFCLKGNFASHSKDEFSEAYSKVNEAVDSNSDLIKEFALGINPYVSDIVSKTKVKKI